MPNRPGLLHIFRHVGTRWTSPSIRKRRPLPPDALRDGVRGLDTRSVLVMDQETSQVASIQDIYPALVREPVQCAPRDGDQRVLVLRRGLRLPVHHQKEEFLLVGQV